MTLLTLNVCDSEGIRRALLKVDDAELVIVVVDASNPNQVIDKALSGVLCSNRNV